MWVGCVLNGFGVVQVSPVQQVKFNGLRSERARLQLTVGQLVMDLESPVEVHSPEPQWRRRELRQWCNSPPSPGLALLGADWVVDVHLLTDQRGKDAAEWRPEAT